MEELLSLSAVYLMLFFMGFTVLRTGLYNLTHEKIEPALKNLTSNHFTGILTGIFFTTILQSSSIIMIITIGFVSVGLLSLRQSIGIILGANIGTTFTGELLAFSEIIPKWSFVVIGAFMLMTNNKLLFCTGTILFGIGSVFVALHGFETLAPLIAEMPVLVEGIQYAALHPETGVLIGILFSGAIQSSSATTGITMSFLHEGLLTMPASIAILLGANIGTCVTGILASLGADRNAKMTAMAHVWFNVFSVLLFVPFINGLSSLAQFLADTPVKQLAHISVLFNIAAVLLILPFIHSFEKFIFFFHGRNR
ncbi:Na/Pi symporter [Sediminibacillus massiliensis]|uniref:Na/Pi symporter n=1 Tax=Sediminibacillus massiliensis TaxID=1926277 RepID=UPI00098856C7|nr:Na/Pi symporter [Sediminibacillus massiliensis]